MRKDNLPRKASHGESALWDGTKSYLRIVLNDVAVETRVGLHAWEKHPERPTRLLVNVALYAHLPEGRSVQNPTRPLIDYDEIRAELKKWPGRSHVPLLETLVDELIHLCFKNPHVEACRVSILKRDIFPEVGGAGVEVYRLRHELADKP